MFINKLLATSLAIIIVLGSISLGFSEPLRVQLEQGIEIKHIQCDNPNHVLVERTNGNLACVFESTAERMGWELVSINFNMNDKLEEFPVEPSDESFDNLTKQDEPTFRNPVDNLDNDTENFVNETVKIISKEKNEFDLLPDQTIGVKPVPKGSLESVMQISPKDVDEFANKIATFVDDEINNRVELTASLRYDTTRGSIFVYGYDANNFTGFEYIEYPKGTTSFVEGEKIIEELLTEFGIALDGTEFKNFYSTVYGEHHFRYIQKKDGILVSSNIVSLSIGYGPTFLKITNWNYNLSELNLIDLDKAQQIGIDYAQTFDALRELPCDIKIEDRHLHNSETSKIELKIINGTPVYVVYSGTCQLSSALINQDFETTMNALTGEPLFIQRGFSI